MINALAFNSGHSPAATSYQSMSLGQSAPGGTARETATFDNWRISCRYFDTFLLQSTHDCA
jgi:hypothetical protein